MLWGYLYQNYFNYKTSSNVKQYSVIKQKIEESDLPTLEKQEVVVKADEAVKSSEIMKIMNAAQDAEYKKLIVAGEPLNKKAQKILEQNEELIEEGGNY